MTLSELSRAVIAIAALGLASAIGAGAAYAMAWFARHT